MMKPNFIDKPAGLEGYDNNNSLTHALLCLLLTTAMVVPRRGLLQTLPLNSALVGCDTHSGCPDLDEHVLNLMMKKINVMTDCVMWLNCLGQHV